MSDPTPSEDGIFWPERDWGDDEAAPELPPLVLVSSNDGRGDPVEVPGRNASWRSVVKLASKLGWTCRVTYALAWSADAYWMNGNVRKAAHHMHSIAVRMTRGAERACAVWSRQTLMPELPMDGWKFQFGMFRSEYRSLTSTEFKGALA